QGITGEAIAVEAEDDTVGGEDRRNAQLRVERERPDHAFRKQPQRGPQWLTRRRKTHDTESRKGDRATTSCGQRRYNTAQGISSLTVTHQTILVLDFGSQYTQLIARRLRELNVYSEVWPPDTPIDKIRAREPAGIILSGGPKSVSDPGAPKCDAG